MNDRDLYPKQGNQSISQSAGVIAPASISRQIADAFEFDRN
jgi:hypothetical protein